MRTVLSATGYFDMSSQFDDDVVCRPPSSTGSSRSNQLTEVITSKETATDDPGGNFTSTSAISHTRVGSRLLPSTPETSRRLSPQIRKSPEHTGGLVQGHRERLCCDVGLSRP
jgi:hypothetical protein